WLPPLPSYPSRADRVARVTEILTRIAGGKPAGRQAPLRFQLPVEPGPHSLPPVPLVRRTREAVALSLVVDRLHLDSCPAQPGMHHPDMRPAVSQPLDPANPDERFSPGAS